MTWTAIGQLTAMTIAIPVALVTWVAFLGPPPLEIREMALVGHEGGVLKGETISFSTKSFKPPWAGKFCTATSGSMMMIDAESVIRQSALVVNWNDGSYQGATIPVMVTTGTATGPEKFGIVATYECFGFNRTIRGPWVTASIKDR